MLILAVRNTKEILRDKLNLFFGLLFPLILLLLLSLINSNVPVEIFNIKELAPGIAVFGLSFMSLFSGMLISKDRSSSFLLRLYVSPLSPSNYIAAYSIPFLIISILQTVICYFTSLILGLQFSFNILIAVLCNIPAAIFFTALGIICGNLLEEKSVGGICGAVLTNFSAWLSGAWFDISLFGKAGKLIALSLPFANAVNAGRAALNGKYTDIFKPLCIVTAYAILLYIIAVIIFTHKMSADKH